MKLLLLAAALTFPVFASAQQVAITFDDLPAHSSLPPGVTRLEVANRVIAALKAADIPPTYGFVNAVQLTREPGTEKVLEAWRTAGFPLGNHGYSHLNLNTTSEADWEADVLKNEPILSSLMNSPADDYHWLRFPFLGEGDTYAKKTAVRAFLLAHGYRIAGVTMSFQDYGYNPPYARCVAKKDTASIRQLEDAYLAAADAQLTRSLELSQWLYHREIPLVLLMHIGAFDSTMLPRLLALYRSRGVAFVSLDEAERDPFYKVDTNLKLPATADSLDALAAGAHLPFPKTPTLLVDLDKLCR
jgi:peptidoglycan/xylan/chitin deacetylase (PgdA/CDA1 family)